MKFSTYLSFHKITRNTNWYHILHIECTNFYCGTYSTTANTMPSILVQQKTNLKRNKTNADPCNKSSKTKNAL